MSKHFLQELRLAALGAGVVLLLTIILAAIGQSALAFAFLTMAILYCVTVLVFRTVLEVNRASGLNDNLLPFTFNPLYRMFYSVVDPRPSRSEQERLEQGELKPFVFKEDTQASKRGNADVKNTSYQIRLNPDR